MGFTWTTINKDVDKVNDSHINEIRSNMDEIHTDLVCYSDNSYDKKFNNTTLYSTNKRDHRSSNRESFRTNEYTPWYSSKQSPRFQDNRAIYRVSKYRSYRNGDKGVIKIGVYGDNHSGENQDIKQPLCWTVHNGQCSTNNGADYGTNNAAKRTSVYSNG